MSPSSRPLANGPGTIKLTAPSNDGNECKKKLNEWRELARVKILT